MENLLFYNLDIKEVVERVQIGPQARVLELIEDFNHQYFGLMTKKLGVTKKFYWKPGAYDTVKEIICALQWFDRKAQTLSKVVQRVRTESTYRIRELHQRVISIEQLLNEFKADGAIMQDNTDDAVEAWELLKNHLTDQLSNLNNVDMRVEETDTDYFLWITYMWTDFNISYKHAEGHDIQDIFCPGNLDIGIKMSITKTINEIIRNKFTLQNLDLTCNQYGRRRSSYSIGGSYNNTFGLQHPYIARDRGWRSGEGYTDGHKYICVGNLDTEIHGCIKALDFVSLGVFLERLALHFDTRTGPMNPIALSYHGQPKFIEDESEYYDIQSRTRTGDCGYRNMIEDAPIKFIKEESYCALYCGVKDKCATYIRNTKELTREERERAAIEQATINAARRLQ
jgi:hypothetical protein